MDKPVKVIRSKSIKLRFSEDELKRVDEKLPHGIVRAVWLRELALNKEVQPQIPMPKCDPELIRSINGIGNNLNQIARKVNQILINGKDNFPMVQLTTAISNMTNEMTAIRKQQTK